MQLPDPGFVPSTPGSKQRYKRRVIFGFGLFIMLSFLLHFTLGPTITSLAPMWRTPDVPDQGVSVVTLSRAKLAIVKPTPTPSPPPRVYIRTIANIAPLKYLEFGLRALRHAIKTPARRTAMLSVQVRVAPSPVDGPDAPAATNVIPAVTPKRDDGAQRDTGANKTRIAGAVVWGDDNPPRLLEMASLSSNSAGRHVRLEVDVGPDGNVLGVKVVVSSGDPALDAAAMDSARKSTYAPATLNGLPVHGTCTIELPVTTTSAT